MHVRNNGPAQAGDIADQTGDKRVKSFRKINFAVLGATGISGGSTASNLKFGMFVGHAALNSQ